MTTTPHSGTDGLTEDQRRTALDRFQILRPHLEEDIPLARIAHEQMLSFRTLSRWAASYHRLGLAGLCRKSRTDRDQRRMSPTLQQFTEGLALEKPQLSAAAVHREAALIAARLGEPVPSYRTVHRVIRGLEPALVTLAHDGAKAYSETFDLVHRTEAKGPNAIWQADHTELDIFVTDGSGKPRKPWLTVILDDYSRAVAGYLLFFSAPSAIQTALALRQAIWRKAQPGWHICGIPQVLYTDHGSDFTSQHLEQVAADLKIRLSFSTVGKPRGRGKIERFFESLSQVCLSRLPGYGRPASAEAAVLTLPQLTRELEHYLIDDYLVTPHSATRQAPQARWEAGGFLPQMPESLERLDLLLLTVPKTRRVSRDGIRFLGMRYIDTTLAAYVGEDVVLRYDPRDVAEVRVFHQDRFLCRAVCQELAGATVTFREIATARNRRRRELRQTLDERRRLVDSLPGAKRGAHVEQAPRRRYPSRPRSSSSDTPMNKTPIMFVETQEHRRFQEFCDACRRDCYIGLCYGMAGVGKTFSARYYTNRKSVMPGAFPPLSAGKLEKGLDRKVVLYTPSVVNSPGQIDREIGRCRGNFSAALLNRLGKEEKPKLTAIEQDMEVKRRAAYRNGVSADDDRAAEFRCERDAYFAEYKQYQSRRREIRDIPILLVIDEADRLRVASLEQVRAIFDQGGMGLVLIGMPGLEKRLARYAQLYSRVGFVHEFCALAEPEARRLLLEGWQPPGVDLPSDGLSDEEALAAILRITDGNFRLLSRLLTQIARVLTINNLLRVTPAVVEVARESLVIGTA